MFRKSKGKMRLLMLGLSTLCTMGTLLWAANQFVDDIDIFELDGNPQNDAASTGDDWGTFFPGGGTGGSQARTFVNDGTGTSIFTTGGSKDENPISKWKHTNGSVPDKNDILNAYAAAYNINGELIVYFGADRFSNDGDANIGFWFLQSEVGPKPDGTFSGEHKDGDIFVVSGFTSGGQTSEIAVYKWVGNDATGSLQLVASSTNAACVADASGTKTACAIANSSPVASPWPFTPKSGSSGTFPVASFFEGGVNVTALLGETPCLSTFLVETRSSTSLTAQLKDFARGTFSLCGMSMTKACDAGRLTANGTSFEYDAKGTVTNTGVGTLYDVVVSDTPPGSNTPVTFNLGTIAGGATACWPNPNDCNQVFTFNTGTTNGPTNTASAAAATAPGGAKTLTAEASDACPVVPTNPALSLTKTCATDLTETSNMVAVQVSFQGQACNTGDIPLNNVTVTNDKAGSTPSSFSLGTLSVGQCKPYGPGTYLPTLKGTPVANGRYLFSDQVTATATPSIGTCGGQATCTQTATASCPLCSPGQCALP